MKASNIIFAVNLKMGGKSWRREMKGWKRWRLQIKSILFMSFILFWGFSCMLLNFILCRYLWKSPANSGSGKGSAVEKQAKAEGPSDICMFHTGKDYATSKAWLHVFYSLCIVMCTPLKGTAITVICVRFGSCILLYA